MGTDTIVEGRTHEADYRKTDGGYVFTQSVPVKAQGVDASLNGPMDGVHPGAGVHLLPAVQWRGTDNKDNDLPVNSSWSHV